MKTYCNLYPQVWNFDNLYLAYRKARKGKRRRSGAAAFERFQEEELLNLRQELCTFTYQPGLYRSFFIYDPKKRLISAAPFRDRVIHHALCRVIEPIWERRFIDDTYANRMGKGTHRALDRAQGFIRRYRYVLQCDVRQFFPSIDHAILRAEIARLIQDDGVLWLVDRILESGVGVLSEAYTMTYFAGDDLFAALRPRGLPIGNLTSQFWANVYLNSFDHFVKRELKCPAYVRYVDDALFFADNRQMLWQWRDAIVQRMADLRLTLHPPQVFPVETGVPFLGFQVFPDHRRVKRRKVVHFRRKLAGLLGRYAQGQVSYASLDASIQGWINHVRFGDTWGLRKNVLDFVLPAAAGGGE